MPPTPHKPKTNHTHAHTHTHTHTHAYYTINNRLLKWPKRDWHGIGA